MKQIIVSIFVLLTACNESRQAIQKKDVDSLNSVLQTNAIDTIKKTGNIWVDRLNGKQYPLPDSIDDKPVSFYLNHPSVTEIAKSLYKGQFRPTDNDSTTELLSYITTKDDTVRPFYRWCLDFTILISDGALGEYPGSPALKYATMFPKEFFDYMDKDISGERYKRWIEIIAYSGLSDYNNKEPEIEAGIVKDMQNKCNKCNSGTKNRIEKFAKDIIMAIKLQD